MGFHQAFRSGLFGNVRFFPAMGAVCANAAGSFGISVGSGFAGRPFCGNRCRTSGPPRRVQRRQTTRWHWCFQAKPVPAVQRVFGNDLSVLLLSLTYIPFQRIAYSLVTVTVSSLLIDWIQNLGRKKPGEDAAAAGEAQPLPVVDSPDYLRPGRLLIQPPFCSVLRGVFDISPVNLIFFAYE